MYKHFQIFFLFFSLLVFAQPKNDLIAIYKGGKKNIFNQLSFAADGKVKVNELNFADYYYENDSLFVIDGQDLVLFLMQKNKIKTISKWSTKEELKLISKTEINFRSDSLNFKKANLLKAYSKNNFPLQVNHSIHEYSEDYLRLISQKNSDLCKEGLDLGCIQQFSYLMSEYENLDEVAKNQHLDDLYNLAHRVITLGNVDGYGLLFSYYILKDQQEEGEIYLEKGLQLGSQLCMLLSMEKLK